MSTAQDRFVGIDAETSGLFPPESKEVPMLLEMGFQIRDAATLFVIDSFYLPIWDDGYSTRLVAMRQSDDPQVKYVVDMHDKSNLWTMAARTGVSIGEAEAEFLAYFHEHGITSEVPIKARDPLFGSSVQFDRQCLQTFMPGLHGVFHYRNVDISTVKELCQRLNPELYSKLPDHTEKRELHRVQPDLDDTFGEFKFYTQNFLYTAI